MTSNLGLRVAVFLAVFALCALAERLLPRRAPTAARGTRWTANLGLGLLGAVLTRLLIPVALVEAAYRAEGARFGLLNQMPIFYPLKFALSLVLMDLLVYWQHRLFHGPRWLWRPHAVHHTDLDLDATTGLRFHPVELLLSAAIKAAGAALLGAHFVAVAAFEILLNAASLFTHANLALPAAVDRVLRFVLVTPDMHRIHHSPSREETDSNFGFGLSWWDRLFGTYRETPHEEHESMLLGLDGARDENELDLSHLLTRPFRRSA